MIRSGASGLRAVLQLAADFLALVASTLQSRSRLAAENLFLRRQLALYVERQVTPRRPDAATRRGMVVLSQWLDGRLLLVVVKPDTLPRWHRRGFRLLWRCKSRPVGRPPIPSDVQTLIAAMASANIMWGEERIAAELQVKCGIRVSPRTARRYMPRRDSPDGGGGPRRGAPSFETMPRPVGLRLFGCSTHRDFCASNPDEVNTICAFLTTPEGMKVVAIAACYCGAMRRASRHFDR